MRIKVVDEEKILFDNGMTITYDHEQDCCERNYAKFEDVDSLAYEVEFTEELDFEAIDGAGFRFGNRPQKMFFVPCYSAQNGYYTTELDIYFNGDHVLGLECEGCFG